MTDREMEREVTEGHRWATVVVAQLQAGPFRQSCSLGDGSQVAETAPGSASLTTRLTEAREGLPSGREKPWMAGLKTRHEPLPTPPEAKTVLKDRAGSESRVAPPLALGQRVRMCRQRKAPVEEHCWPEQTLGVGGTSLFWKQVRLSLPVPGLSCVG